MKKSKRENLMSVLGSIFLVFGGLFTITFYLNSNYVGLFASALSVIVGLILLAISFGN